MTTRIKSDPLNAGGKDENMLITAINALAMIAAMCRPFAAPDGGGAGEQDPAGAGEPSGNANTPAGTDPKQTEPSFDDMLKNKAYQSEFDKRVNKALETAKEKWDADAKAQADEAAKLAKMKADEKEEYQRKQREDALAKREAEITRRELHAEAITQLTADGLPASLADIVDCTNVDYAPMVEYGTGSAGDPSVPHTAKVRWVYFDSALGEFRTVYPQPPRPYMRPAFETKKAVVTMNMSRAIIRAATETTGGAV